ncbi:MAG: TonB-dependent receptor [Croceibacterium sp.]
MRARSDGRSAISRLGIRFLLGSGLIALSVTQAHAQDATAGASDPAPGTESDQATEPADEGQPIIVTGSRIGRRDYQSNSPISTIGGATLATTGQTSLDKAIGELPQFSAAQGAAEVGDVQGGIGFSGGQSNGDLRGLGANRSLVLLDGRRLMPSAPDGSIDLNTIPTLLIDTVEVITGGASATYGSDAIAGVVNFKLRQNFSGLEISSQFGGATAGDGRTTQVGAIIGGNFGENRGNAVLAFEYSNRAAVTGASRPFFQNIRQLNRPPEGEILAGNFGSSGSPTIAAVNAALAQYPGTTPIAGTGAYRGAIGVNTDQSVFTTLASPNCVQNYRGLGAIPGLNISANCTQVQVALGNYFDVQVPLTKYNAFAGAHYDLTEDITAYGQFNFLESTARDTTGPGSTKASGRIILSVPQNSPFVTGNPALQGILASITPTPTGPLKVTKLLTAFGNRVESFKYDVWQAVGGLKGQIPGTGLSFDVYASLGHSQFTNIGYGDVSLSRVNNIVGGTADGAGCSGFAWNPLGNNPLSAACLAYAGRTIQNTNTQTQRVIEGTVNGALFSLPAGELKFAVGADYRVNEFNYQPDNALIVADTIPYDSISAASGKQSVKEAFGELLVPIFSDQPFAKELSLDLGYRYSKYDSFSGKSTYKADVSWAPIEELRFRGGYSIAFRAPSLLDLSGPTTVGQINVGPLPSAGDPCSSTSSLRTGANATQVAALCVAQGVPSSAIANYTYGSVSVGGTSGANALLTPENAKTWSVGVVIDPRFSSPLLSHLQLSVDYYNISVTDAIGTLNATDILPRCFNSDGASNPSYSLTNAYCVRITRDPATGTIVNIGAGKFNFATYKVDGIDTQLAWRIGLDALGASSKAGSIEINSIVSYTRGYTVAGLFGSPTLDYAGSSGFGGVGGGISHPKWKANTSLAYVNGDLSITGRWRYIDKMIHSDVVANPAATTPGIPAYSYFDVNAFFDVAERFTFGIGVNNLTNKIPPFISAAPLTTDAATYDVIGRRWFVSAKVKF